MVEWDSAPHTLSTARNLQSLYSLYGRGMDELYRSTGIDTGSRGRALRAGRLAADAYLAWLTTLAGHEFGHCQQAWLGGAGRCQWIAAPGPYALGHVISVPVDEYKKLSAQGRMAVTAGGTMATVSGADTLKRDAFEAGEAHWTTWPLLAFRQVDFPLYGLTAPSPANAKPQDYANDMTNYAITYGARSGMGGEAVHVSIVHAAAWQLADPFTWLGAWTYLSRYIGENEHVSGTPSIHAGSRQWTMTTSAWLSEVGVRYRLGVFMRDASGTALEVTPEWGEGQPQIGIRWSWPIGHQLRAAINADAWSQRASATPGPKLRGGAFTGGLNYTRGRTTVSFSVGRKGAGAMLGQPQSAAWLWSVAGALHF